MQFARRKKTQSLYNLRANLKRRVSVQNFTFSTEMETLSLLYNNCEYSSN